jgi:hypothetical protein
MPPDHLSERLLPVRSGELSEEFLVGDIFEIL